jgi:myo-inositol catabolism protein IolS
MELRSLGTSDVKITPIIMGTWQAGKSMWAGIDDAEIIKAIRTAFQAGITTFDTAEEYGKGHSERILGKALADVRDQVVYATKVFPNHLTYDQVIGAFHRSLKNLKIDYIDLYQIHWPAGSWGSKYIPIEETMRAMNDLKEQGKIRAIGVSNFSRIQLEEAATYARIDSLQPPYSLFWRHVEKDTMPYCVKNKLLLPENSRRVQRALAKLRPIARRNGVSLGQLALAWVIAQPNTCAIAGARNSEQVLQNAQGAEFHLSAADLSKMDTIGHSVTDDLDDNPVMWKF